MITKYDLDTDDEKRLKKLVPEFIAQYDDLLIKATNELSMKGKLLSRALSEQAGLYAYYSLKKSEIKAVIKMFEVKANSAKGGAIQTLMERSDRAYGERPAAQIAQSNKEYIMYSKLLLELEEIYDKLSAVVEAFNIRGFALRDYTAARIAEVHAAQIDI